jgi:molybdopterin molybdotransferase
MLSVAEAQERIIRLAPLCEAVPRAALEAVGCVLAEDVASDIDSPPYDKSLVDGYAVRCSDLASTPVELRVLEEVTAGSVPTRAVEPGTATRVMTGAPLPAGADAVVMVERTKLLQGTGSSEPATARVVIEGPTPQLGANILHRAAAVRAGTVVYRAGHVLRPCDVGVLAELGHTSVRVVAAPTLAVVATGNELVPATQQPELGQIRNSNGPMLAALAATAGVQPQVLGIARDTVQDLRRLLGQGLQCDVLVLSGGVSVGVLDLVPRVLAELGVAEVFHGVNLRPGKPLWFGSHGGATRPRLVFGLPGNPVSSLVCFELFVRPALRRMAGHAQVLPQPRVARLAEVHQQRGDRPTYHPAVLTDESGPVVRPLRWQGSADLAALAAANALAYFPGGDARYEPGHLVDTYPIL